MIKLTGNKLPNPAEDIKHAPKDVGDKSEETGNETQDPRNKRVGDGVCRPEEGRDQLEDGGDEVRDCRSDCHFFFFVFLYFVVCSEVVILRDWLWKVW